MAEKNQPAEREPPQSMEHEMCLLGCILLDKDAIAWVSDLVREDDFARFDHRAIWKAAVRLYAEGKPVNLITVPEALRISGELAEVGGVTYIAELSQCVPFANEAAHYAEVVRERAMLRDMISACHAGINESYDAVEPAGEILERTQGKLMEVLARGVGTRDAMASIGQAADEAYKEAILRRDNPEHGALFSGFPEIDDFTGGWLPGELWLLAARPGGGKSAFALQWAEWMAEFNHIPGLFFSLEMRRQALAMRLMCARAKVNGLKIRSGRGEPEDYAKLDLQTNRLAAMPFTVVDRPGMSIAALRAHARMLKASKGIRWIVLDYLQLIAPNTRKGGTRENEVGEISRGLQLMARELDITVLALAQLNREGDDEPKLRHLRESGSLEQEANGVLALHIPDPRIRSSVKCSILKGRDGMTGDVMLRFVPERTCFEPAGGNVPREYQTREAMAEAGADDSGQHPF